MNLIQFSNYCNLIAQQAGFKGYHYGYESDMQRNIQNNLNPNNTNGNQYPFVLLEPVLGSWVFLKDIGSSNSVRLNFFNLQHRGNDGQTSTDIQSIEQMQTLLNNAKQFVLMLFQVAKTTPSAFGIEAATVQYETLEAQHPDKLLQVAVTMTVQWKEDCPDLDFNPAAVLAPYTFPPSNETDYEKING